PLKSERPHRVGCREPAGVSSPPKRQEQKEFASPRNRGSGKWRPGRRGGPGMLSVRRLGSVVLATLAMGLGSLTAAQSAVAATAKPKSGGSLLFEVAGNIDSLDPGKVA